MEKYLSNYILRTSLADSAIIERKARTCPEVSEHLRNMPEKAPKHPAINLLNKKKH